MGALRTKIAAAVRVKLGPLLLHPTNQLLVQRAAGRNSPARPPAGKFVERDRAALIAVHLPEQGLRWSLVCRAG